MRISYTPEQEELRRELRSYFTKLMTPERAEALAAGDAGEIGARQRLPRDRRADGQGRLADAVTGPRSSAARRARRWTR